VHRTYKQQTSARMGKLSKFFGTAPPLDISVPEIEKNGLKAALMSKIPLAYFLYALLEDYSCENLFFFLEVEHYVATQFADDVPVVLSARCAAQHIVDTYLSRNSNFEINIDDRVRRDVVTTLAAARATGAGQATVFDAAQRAVLLLLESSWQKFIRGDVF
ncbi:RGS domain-containing protein, partial [Phlyctochytrium arcticum]